MNNSDGAAIVNSKRIYCSWSIDRFCAWFALITFLYALGLTGVQSMENYEKYANQDTNINHQQFAATSGHKKHEIQRCPRPRRIMEYFKAIKVAQRTNRFHTEMQCKKLDEHKGYVDSIPENSSSATVNYSADSGIWKLMDDIDKILNQNKTEEAFIRSSLLLEQALTEFESLLYVPGIPDELFFYVAERVMNQSIFQGSPGIAADIQRALVEKFPERIELKNQLGLIYIRMDRIKEAKLVFEDVLRLDTTNGFAKVHYGYILMDERNDIEQAVKFLREGINSGAEGTIHPLFYHDLGEALQLLGRNDEAYEIFDEGAQLGFFLSKEQRSLQNCYGITARPWWTVEQTSYSEQLKAIESQWHLIRDEVVTNLFDNGQYFNTAGNDNLIAKGDWRQLTLFKLGHRNDTNCAKTPKTCAIVGNFREAVECQRCSISFSVMLPGTKIHPHCGPTNCRLRAHLGLVVPVGPRIRVANETRTWKQGEFIVFDDSFEHEVWHDGSKPRVILMIDVWHPEVTKEQRALITPLKPISL